MISVDVVAKKLPEIYEGPYHHEPVQTGTAHGRTFCLANSFQRGKLYTIALTCILCLANIRVAYGKTHISQQQIHRESDNGSASQTSALILIVGAIAAWLIWKL